MQCVWKDLHSNYQTQQWVAHPSLFAETAIQYFPPAATLLELGAGHGQDSVFFASKDYQVTSTDIEISSLSSNNALKGKARILQLDLQQKLPFADQSFDVVYAHLSIHYFNEQTTRAIIAEVWRVLKHSGVFAFLANSVDDPEYGSGILIEKDFFLIDKVTKRYFNVQSAADFTQMFQVALLDNLGQTYKDRAKGVSNLVRFIGNKV